jgi:polysaccharide pyruvyl transferase CsaB
MNYHWRHQKAPFFRLPGALWRNSYFGHWVDFIQNRANVAWVRLLGRLRFGIKWPDIIEGLIILGAVFMPVLSSWWLLLPLLLLLWVTRPSEDTRTPGAGWLFVWVILVISAFLSPRFTAGLPVLARFGSWFGLAWMMGRILSPAQISRILKYLGYTSLIWLTIAFWQLFSGIPTPRGWLGLEQAGVIPVRIYSVFGNPNIFALYLLAMMVISRYLAVKSTQKIEKYILSGIFILILAALYFTYTRMAWLLAVLCLMLQADKNRWRFGLLISGIMVILFMTFPDFNLRLGSMAHLHDSSLQYRLQIWRGTGEALKDYWLWGAGPGSFQAIYPQYQMGNIISQHAHQFYLQFWLEHGLFAFIALLAALRHVLTSHRQAGISAEMKTLSMVLAVFLAYGFSETWYIHHFIGGYFWFLTGLLQASKRESIKKQKDGNALHIAIFGYFGCDNLGDETNLRELVVFLREIQPGIGITVISALPRVTAKELGVESVNKYDWAKITGVFRKADLLIGGGGSLFQDRSSFRSLVYYVGLVLLARRSRLDVFLYGQGIGPVRSRMGKWMAGWALSQVKVITLRDRLSQLALEELRVSGPVIHLTAEPLLIKEQIPESAVKRYWEGIPTGGGYKLGFIPCEFGGLDIRFWSRLLDALSRDNPGIYLMATAKEDWSFHQRLSKEFGIPILPVQNCWEMLQKAAGGVDLVVSARLHGLVAAVVQGSACYGLALDPKIEGFCIPLRISYCRLTVQTNPLLLCREILDNLKRRGAAAQKPRQPAPVFWKNHALRNQTVLKQMILRIRRRDRS